MKPQLPLKLSLSDFVFYRLGVLGYSLEKMFAFAKQVGYDGIEMTESIATRWMGSKNVKAISEYYDLPITSVHHSLSRMVLSTYGSVRRLIKRAEGVGAKAVVVHLASVHKTFQPDYFAQIKKLEQEHNIIVAFENAMTQFKFLKTPAAEYTYEPDKFVNFIKKENLSVTYDLGHMAGLSSDIVGMYEKLKERLAIIHLQDYIDGYDHRPLGSGVLPLPQFLQHLVKDEYQGILTLEVFPRNINPFVSNKKVEQIMIDCLDYFKQHTAIQNYENK
jgi:sugar phosphate isomerase/epimerase